MFCLLSYNKLVKELQPPNKRYSKTIFPQISWGLKKILELVDQFIKLVL